MEVFSPGTYEYLVFGKLWVCVWFLHSKLETGKCGHDLTFKSTPHLATEWYGPFFKKKREEL